MDASNDNQAEPEEKLPVQDAFVLLMKLAILAWLLIGLAIFLFWLWVRG